MKCDVCFRKCDLKDGQIGFCKGGKIETVKLFPAITAAFLPRRSIRLKRSRLSILPRQSDSLGRQLRLLPSLSVCQNHEISQQDLEGQCETVTPQQLIDKALSLVPYGNIGIAFTYNEPLIGYEFVRDSARLAKENGLKTVPSLREMRPKKCSMNCFRISTPITSISRDLPTTITATSAEIWT